MIDRFPVGLSFRRTVVVSTDMVDHFAALSGDASPLHMDAKFAVAHGFRRRVVHGLLLGGLVSSVVGSQLPGPLGVLQEMKLSFHQPCFADQEITITATVVEYHAALRVLTCKVEIVDAAGQVLARGNYRSGVLEQT